MGKRTPLAVITILEIKDRNLTPDEYQRFLHACAQVVKPKEPGPKWPGRKGKILRLDDFRR